MDFNFKSVKEPTDRKLSPYLSPGSGQVLKINDIVLTCSQNTKNPRPVFYMESEPINDAEFKGIDGARGRVGKVSGNGGYYLNNDNQKTEFLGFLKAIANAVGQSAELQAVEATSFEELVEQAKKVLCGHYARYFVAGTEFSKPDNRYGVKLIFLSRKAVESVDTDPSGLDIFDWNNPKHYKKIPKATTEEDFGVPNGTPKSTVSTTKVTTDDLPF